MQTVVLAAGRGTRMRPLTDTIPKPMLPVADRPLVAHVADAAILAGASRLLFVVGYGADAIRAYFTDRYRSVPVTYIEQSTQRGTADALRTARPSLDPGQVVVLNGDVLIDVEDLSSLYTACPALGVSHVDHPEQYGVIEIDETTGSVQQLLEKPAEPPTNLVNAGAYSFPYDALDQLDDIGSSDRGEFELTDLVAQLCRSSDVTPIRFERWMDVGRPWELLAANEWKLSEIEHQLSGEVSPHATLTGKVCVEADAVVHSGVTIEGPALIRQGASVGPNAFIRGATLIDSGATVGHAVEIKNSLLFPSATVGHQSYVGDSILGPRVNFGAGTNVANLRHDDKPIQTIVKGEPVSTGRRKYGVVIGADSKTGIDTSLNAGVVLPCKSTTMPGETILRSPE